MTAELILANSVLVCDDEVVRGTLVIGADGMITDVEASGRPVSGVRNAVDLEGDYLIPGAVEVHTDNYERHLVPRPAVMWPAHQALLAHDAEIAAAGITTVLDAVSLGDYDTDGFRVGVLKEAMAALEAPTIQHNLRADHYLHLRCETADPEVVNIFDAYAAHPMLRMVSLMDHTPGQRQWSDLASYRTFYSRRSGTSPEEFEEVTNRRLAQGVQYAAANRRALVERLRSRSVAFANHDDTTVEHVDEGAADGATMSEFPTTEAAARRAVALGMLNVAGAPNVVRGGSHSGNVSAAALAAAGLLHILSSDYVPRSLVHAAWVLHGLGTPLTDAVRMIAGAPAAAVGFTDRGFLRQGLRGDVTRVRPTPHGPAVRTVWKLGQRIA